MTQEAMPEATVAARRGPDHPQGIRRVQVGCGPHNVMDDWWNVDIRGFKGVDAVMDVTKPWPWRNTLDLVYGEHFLEHLDLDGAVMFLRHAGEALRRGGRLRLSTPSLEWVLATHFKVSEADPERAVSQTLAINRAFHGWGHKFLYSRQFLEALLSGAGFREIEFFEYGVSGTRALDKLERHGGHKSHGGLPSVWNVEAVKIGEEMIADPDFVAKIENEFTRHVRAGH